MKEKIIEILKSSRDTIGFESKIADEIINSLIIPVDKDNLPKHVVMAISENGSAKAGLLHKTEMTTGVKCDSFRETLFDVTHYMEIPKL